jgi:hypothetical protein
MTSGMPDMDDSGETESKETKESGEGIADVATKLGDAADGVIEFIARYLRTLAILFIKPIRATTTLRYSQLRPNSSRYLSPIAFLFLSAFFLAQALSYLGRSSEEFNPLELARRLRESISPELSTSQLIFVSLPLVGFVLLAAALGGLMTGHAAGKKRLTMAMCYAFGAQFTGVFLWAAYGDLLQAAVVNFSPPDYEPGRTFFIALYLPLLYCAVLPCLVVWPTMVSVPEFKVKLARPFIILATILLCPWTSYVAVRID